VSLDQPAGKGFVRAAYSESPMAGEARAFKAFEAAGWSRGAFVLNHLLRPEVAAAEFARVLVSGGRLALSVWDVPERARFIERHRVAGGHELPAVAKVGSGRRP
jgi:SAM-dependent methyltransferase